MSAENNFYQLLENIFCGKNIQGKSGYVNLLGIKHTYYKNILDIFCSEIDEEKLIAGSFKEEFYDKLCCFFEKYFSEAGSIYFVNTARNKNVYEKVYSNNEDVTLFYKTNMLYYVKSETLYENMEVKVNDNISLFFDVSKIENKKNNEKTKLFFSFNSLVDNTITIDVTYTKGNAKTNIGGIVKEVKKKGIAVSEDDIAKGIRNFEKQSQIDYFVNKNASKFLNEQLEYYMHDLLLNEENVFDSKRLEKIKLIYKYAKKITAFIAQFEDELVRIWDKPKFVHDLGFLCSIGLLSDELLGEITTHENFQKQVEKWILQKQISESDSVDLKYLQDKKHNYLMIDTKLFSDMEKKIVNEGHANVNGVLINSDNYQALNSIKKKYDNSVDIIYIDPPYNTEADSFDYVDGYESASYLSMMYDRLNLAKKFLRDDGIIYISINDKQLYELKLLCDKIFDKSNFVCNFIRKIKAGRTTASCIDLHHDYMLCYAKNKKAFESANIVGAGKIENRSNIQMINGKPYKKRNPIYKVDGGRKGSQYKVHNPYLNIDHYPPIHYNPAVRFGWFLGQENYKIAMSQEAQGLNDGYEWQIVFIKTEEEWETYKEQKKKKDPNLKDEDIYSFYFLKREPKTDVVEYNHLSSLFCAADTKYNNAAGTSELNAMLDNIKSEGEWISDIHPKPVSLISDIILYSTRYKDEVTFMDFFGGSGTSGEAVIAFAGQNPDVRVNYVLVEVNDYSETVLKRRIEKAHDKLGVEGLVKYYSLEQYADTLMNVKYNPEQHYMKYSSVSPQYIFAQDAKLINGVKIDEKISLCLEDICKNIDLNETISNLLGRNIIAYTDDGIEIDDKGKVVAIKTNYMRMSDDEKLKLILLIRPLLWWGE